MLMSQGQMLLAHIIYNIIVQMLLSQYYLLVIMVHDATEPYGC